MLEETYRKIQNALALNILVKPVSIPKPNLAIDDGEKLKSHPILVFTDAYANMNKKVVLDKRKPVEYAGMKGDGLTLKEADFYHGFVLGDPIGEGV